MKQMKKVSPTEEQNRQTITEARGLLQRQDMGVLATYNPAQGPHTSLMAYVHHPEQDTIWLLSPGQGKKIDNLRQSPKASLLVDSREQEHQRSQIQALTVNGTVLLHACPADRRDILRIFSQQHQHLGSLLQQEGLMLLELQVQSYLLLRGANHASFVRLPTLHADQT
ncbi:Pyridoxamine 5'-phosphate oxidase [Paucidesulfovibrio gracilis DSM 16080]|uniref:Pyridoxamine 5'-phosphate oxidase n=1 Tax=Paucidesulfovibrio gracilis DSM 16080 TaxID=1121449 RepID=A0A1T4XWX6_9BACT|nr:pyridoxamine 5'-phosphate oxidase family protein [Paucidesulfovibrio gracilis]SKA94036.1 Pyridoxamine 5'-phosphate oxidase [Paucidesulfovibrio gracilis DSM 16080]